jgi:hypothetical protein
MKSNYIILNTTYILPLNNGNSKNNSPNVSAGSNLRVVVQIVVQMKKAATKKSLKTCL